CRARRRRLTHRSTRSGEPGPPRGAVPRRSAALLSDGTRRTAPAARVRLRRAAPRRGSGPLSGPLPAGARRQSVPVRATGGAVQRPVQNFLEQGSLSARGFDRVLRLAWTVADLSGSTSPGAEEVAEALYFRTGRASTWAA